MNLMLDLQDVRLIQELLRLKTQSHAKEHTKGMPPTSCDTCTSIIFIERQIKHHELEQMQKERFLPPRPQASKEGL